jgi:predicted nucleic acid-binding protein
MDRGIDTTFLVQVEIKGHARHAQARAQLGRMLDAGDRLALAPQVLAEFIHVVTDPMRFSDPLDVAAASERAEQWWSAEEVRQVSPDDHAVQLFFQWMAEHRLGRKRLLDTMLAATYFAAGVTSIVSTSARDFKVFGAFEVVEP